MYIVTLLKAICKLPLHCDSNLLEMFVGNPCIVRLCMHSKSSCVKYLIMFAMSNVCNTNNFTQVQYIQIFISNKYFEWADISI